MNIKKLKDKLIYSTFIQISNYKNLVLSYSGGLDSTVLLDLLFSLKNKNISNAFHFHIRAIHVNHNLSRNSNSWEKHCLIECKKRNIEMEVKNIYISDRSSGIEKIMREKRYKIIQSSMKKKEVLLTAHHRNDHVETFFLALKRGSGPCGLSAISNSKKNFLSLGYQVIRPLLNFDRKTLEIYAKYYNLNWVEDESNNNVRFDRNFLRLHILPKLYKRWSFFSNSVLRSAKLCADQELLINELLKETISNLIYFDQSLQINNMKSMSEVKRHAIIRRWLLQFKINMPSFKRICCLWNEIALSKKDSRGEFSVGNNKQICRFQNRLYILPIYKSNNLLKNIYWFKKKIYVKLPNNMGILFRQEIFHEKSQIKKFFEEEYCSFSSMKRRKCFFSVETGKKIYKKITIVRAPTQSEKISIRFKYKNNELLKVLGFNCRKKIKKIWKELEIPFWQRNTTPLLFYNERLIAAIGIFLTYEGIPDIEKKIWKIFWYHNNDNFVTC